MKHNYFSLLPRYWVWLLVAGPLHFAGCVLPAQVDAPATLRVMDSLLDQQDYFRLEKQLAYHAGALSTARRLYFSAIVDNAFNRNGRCIARVDSLMGASGGPRESETGVPDAFPDSLRVKLLRYQEDAYFKMGEYAAAAGVDSLLLRDYKGAMDSATSADVRNDSLIRHALRGVLPQEVQPGRGSMVTWTRNGIGLIEIPVRMSGQVVSAIFDTRANISSITQSFAEMLHLRLLDVRYNEGSGSTGIQFKVGLGIVDSLRIGNVLVRNAIFQVMPDSIFYIAPIHFQLNIIIGFPIIAGLQEVRISDDGKMVIPAPPTPSDLHNMEMSRLDPVIRVFAGADTLLFHFDTGADNTMLYSGYFNRHRAAVLRSGIKKETMVGGAGGVKTNETYVLPALPLRLGEREATIDSVNVLTEKIFPGERLSGNIGQDFMGHFRTFVIDFKYMYVKAE